MFKDVGCSLEEGGRAALYACRRPKKSGSDETCCLRHLRAPRTNKKLTRREMRSIHLVRILVLLSALRSDVKAQLFEADSDSVFCISNLDRCRSGALEPLSLCADLAFRCMARPVSAAAQQISIEYIAHHHERLGLDVTQATFVAQQCLAAMERHPKDAALTFSAVQLLDLLGMEALPAVIVPSDGTGAPTLVDTTLRWHLMACLAVLVGMAGCSRLRLLHTSTGPVERYAPLGDANTATHRHKSRRRRASPDSVMAVASCAEEAAKQKSVPERDNRMPGSQSVHKPHPLPGHEQPCEPSGQRELDAASVNEARAAAWKFQFQTGNERGAERSSSEEESSLCVVCLDAPRTHAMLPCGHRCVCHSCTGGHNRCPLCRTEVQGTVRVWN